MIILYKTLHRFKELQTFSCLKAFAKEIPLFSCLYNAKSVASSQNALLLCLQPERDKHTEQNEHLRLTVQISPNYGQPCVPCYILTCLPCECRCQVSETAGFRHVTAERFGCSGLF
ncbi:THO complex subunit 6-like protein [Platysternon megacephalum]|uniref:THO complex subunit 6-like protein n=1 Tax=Platysternon megacephalum TaxID=55544 RepID=A0A4D9DXB0_9SAUR|nr:THO complex subunit 6-like protein [Platysternon megacephalum]